MPLFPLDRFIPEAPVDVVAILQKCSESGVRRSVPVQPPAHDGEVCFQLFGEPTRVSALGKRTLQLFGSTVH